MIDLLKKTMFTGIGLALKSKDEAEELIRDFIKQGNVSEKEGQTFIKDARKWYDEAQQKMEDRVDESVKKFMKKAGVVTVDDLKGLKKEIRDLKKAMSQLDASSEK